MIAIISYWFFIWFLLFMFNLTLANPFWILLISYFITFGEFIFLISKGANKYNLTKFMIINVLLKFIPILIIAIKMNFKIPINIYDFKIAFIIIIFYIVIMISVNKNPIIEYKNMLNTYISNDNKYRTYISRLYDDIYSFWYSIRISI